MAEETPNTMNLDLNLGPIDHSSETDTLAAGSGTITDDSMNLEDWLDSPVNRFREVVRHRRRWRSVWRHIPMPPEARDMALELIGGGSGLQAGEGSIAPEERADRPAVDSGKVCEANNGFLKDGILKKNDDDEKGSGDAGSFFDCNICLDLSKDPVVTCCGHLFCWSCLYRWLHVHSDAKECPVCKGEVTTKNLTPIYGRGKNAPRNLEEDDSSLKIPLRPQARRVESLRQVIQRTALNLPMEEMIRLLNGRFDLSQVHTHNSTVDAPPPPRESPERTTSFLNRFLSSRGIRRESPNNVLSVSPDDVVVDLSHPSDSTHPELIGESQSQSRRISSLFLRRSNSSQAATISHLTSALSSAERLVESYFRSNNPPPPVSAERDHHHHHQEQQQTLPPDDRDSISSIAAVIHSESQTVDTAVEIDSTVSRSTSSSRRRQQDTSRISDVDSGDSRAPRRRRLG
ncbi:OLC1v1038220C1 [Oldenlandia corymbosa var. corymbosa]|uniref:E3 ubiquitin-protein ligase RMA n=1 Tax=Oldenlandia corymbosa var. corymbosa TaxID=529605 RepID=A0AAV1CZ97_OLDCO|nr:OLC1v1038220C1 [Oldenlandia corymbosa var. corymbosa]